MIGCLYAFVGSTASGVHRRDTSLQSGAARKAIDRVESNLGHSSFGLGGVHQLESGKGVGEDVGFCSKLRCAGFNIYVDTSIEIDHMTIMGVNRDFYKLYGHVEGVKKVDGRMIRQEG